MYKLLVLGSPHGVMAKLLDCSLEVSEFKLQLPSYVYFWTYTFIKGMNSLIPPVLGWIVSLVFFYMDALALNKTRMLICH